MWIVVVRGIGAAAFIVLLWLTGAKGSGVEPDAIRTASIIMVAAGGAVALPLAARRQQYAEQTLEHQREVARVTNRTPLRNASPNCTPARSTNSAPKILRSGSAVCTPWNA